MNNKGQRKFQSVTRWMQSALWMVAIVFSSLVHATDFDQAIQEQEGEISQIKAALLKSPDKAGRSPASALKLTLIRKDSAHADQKTQSPRS